MNQNLEELKNDLVGTFDNQEQFEQMSKEEQQHFPFARHRNFLMNPQIEDLPADFAGYYLFEESYYDVHGSSRFKSDLFLIRKSAISQVELLSVDLPKEARNKKYEELPKIKYEDLAINPKFNPIRYAKSGEDFYGKSVSEFTPTTTFELEQTISPDMLNVKETMYSKGKQVFGFDEPIIFQRNNMK